MAKTKARKKITAPSPLRVAAEQSLSPEARQHADYTARRFQERGCDRGLLDGMRMEKIACVRPLEGLARKHPKARRAFLDTIHLLAVNAYHADLQSTQGQSSHAVREAIDVSPDAEASFLYRVEARQKITRIKRRMPEQIRKVLDTILIYHPDATLVSIWPNRAERDRAKAQIKEGLDWLAVEYGLISGR